MNISEMIAEGNRILAEEERKRNEEVAMCDAAVKEARERVYQNVKAILPEGLGDWLSRADNCQPKISFLSNSGYTADDWQTLELSVPACAPIRFSVLLGNGNIRNIKVGYPTFDDEGNLYYTFNTPYEYDEFYTALATAEKNYTKYGEMEATETARRLAKSQDQPKKDNWLDSAKDNYWNVYSDASTDLVLSSIAAALIGILEHLKEREAQP